MKKIDPIVLELLGKLSMFDNQSPGCFVLKYRVQVDDFVGEILGLSSWAKKIDVKKKSMWLPIVRSGAALGKVRVGRDLQGPLFATFATSCFALGHSNILPIMICHVRTPNEECLKGGVV